jgi:processing peptidase subunit beta
MGAIVGLRRGFASTLARSETSHVPEFYESVQFSKSRLTDFGELPRGEIPNALKYSPAHSHIRLSNGVQVVTESYPGEVTSVSVFIKAGSRFETIETSGASHFLTYYLARSSKLRNRNEFRESLDELGVSVEVTTGRELIGLTIKCNSQDVHKAIELLAEAISQPDFNSNQVEADKEFVHRQNLDVCRDQFRFLREALFYTAFREHMIGQSEFGIRDNIPNLKAADLEQFHSQNFVGNNVVFVVSGKADCSLVYDTVQKHTHTLAAELQGEQNNSVRPRLTPVVMVQRDDEMYNLNHASGFLAPAFGADNFFPLKFFEKILGDYNAETDGVAHLNAVRLVTNPLHAFWSATTGIHLGHTKYEAFSDVGLFSLYVHGNDYWGKEMFYGLNYIASRYSLFIDQYNIFRGRALLFNELLQQRASKELNEDIAKEIFYIGRRITRTEYAFRYSNLADAKELQPALKSFFYNKEVAMASWGPEHNISNFAYYGINVNKSTRSNALNLIG